MEKGQRRAGWGVHNLLQNFLDLCRRHQFDYLFLLNVSVFTITYSVMLAIFGHLLNSTPYDTDSF